MSKTTDISFPLDQEGFISQECPDCMKVFKVVMAAGTGKPLSFCPYCGYNGRDCWWTQAQVDYIQAVQTNAFMNPAIREFQRNIQGLNNPSGGFTVSTTPIQDEPVRAPVESNAPLPKHTFACCDETIKHASWTAPLHCIICGRTDG